MKKRHRSVWQGPSAYVFSFFCVIHSLISSGVKSRSWASERALERPIDRSSNRGSERSIGRRPILQALAALARISECITKKMKKRHRSVWQGPSADVFSFFFVIHSLISSGVKSRSWARERALERPIDRSSNRGSERSIGLPELANVSRKEMKKRHRSVWQGLSAYVFSFLLYDTFVSLVVACPNYRMHH